MAKRYTVTGDNYFEREDEDGKFVLFADYDAVVAERDKFKEKVDFVVRKLLTISYMVTREGVKV